MTVLVHQEGVHELRAPSCIRADLFKREVVNSVTDLLLQLFVEVINVVGT